MTGGPDGCVTPLRGVILYVTSLSSVQGCRLQAAAGMGPTEVLPNCGIYTGRRTNCTRELGLYEIFRTYGQFHESLSVEKFSPFMHPRVPD